MFHDNLITQHISIVTGAVCCMLFGPLLSFITYTSNDVRNPVDIFVQLALISWAISVLRSSPLLMIWSSALQKRNRKWNDVYVMWPLNMKGYYDRHDEKWWKSATIWFSRYLWSRPTRCRLWILLTWIQINVVDIQCVMSILVVSSRSRARTFSIFSHSSGILTIVHAREKSSMHTVHGLSHDFFIYHALTCFLMVHQLHYPCVRTQFWLWPLPDLLKTNKPPPSPLPWRRHCTISRSFSIIHTHTHILSLPLSRSLSLALWCWLFLIKGAEICSRDWSFVRKNIFAAFTKIILYKSENRNRISILSHFIHSSTITANFTA